MHKYRLFLYDAEDRVIAPPMVISADNDRSAIEQAETMLDGVRAELRDGDRLVIRLPSETEEMFTQCTTSKTAPIIATNKTAPRNAKRLII